MSNYEVGYRKPPKHSRFKKGVRPNPRGRGKRAERSAPVEFGQIIRKVLREKIEFDNNGARRKASRLELTIRQLVIHATKGDLDSVAMLLKLRAHAAKYPETRSMVITIRGGLPDPPDPD